MCFKWSHTHSPEFASPLPLKEKAVLCVDIFTFTDVFETNRTVSVQTSRNSSVIVFEKREIVYACTSAGCHWPL